MSLRDPVPVERLHEATYFSLRVVMALLALALPPMLLFAAAYLDGVPMKPSISAFYFTEMRDIFVGALVAIGVCLFAYKGHTRLENHALSAAGLFLIGVALCPTDPGDAETTAGFLHLIFAVCFFVLIAAVCIFGRCTVVCNPDYRLAYRIIAVMMIGLLLTALVGWPLIESGPGSFVFWVEASAIWIFAAYWIAKTLELRGLERSA